jgi:hypothetical protein
VAVDANTNIYTTQSLYVGDNNSWNAIWCFTNWDGTEVFTNNPAWVLGSNANGGVIMQGDDNPYVTAEDCALDNRLQAKYLAVPQVYNTSGSGTLGIRILDPATGTTIADNIGVPGTYNTVAWDNVGNLYACGIGHSANGIWLGQYGTQNWRGFSPPGANTNTAVAYPTLTIVPLPPPPFPLAYDYDAAVINSQPVAFYELDETNIASGGLTAVDSMGSFNGTYQDGALNGYPGPTPSAGCLGFHATNTCLYIDSGAYLVPKQAN